MLVRLFFMRYPLSMTDKTIRRGIPFDEEDEKLLEALKKRLQPKFGTLGATAIVRMGLRALMDNTKPSK